MKYYTGIGSRKTPQDILQIMSELATCLEKRGYTLRSGGADGADTAFESGVMQSSKKEIFIPWNKFNGRKSSEDGVYVLDSNDTLALEIASQIHPNWKKLKDSVRKLHTRNVYQVLGQDLSTPVEMLICWAPIVGYNKITGGTATAYNLALSNNIRVFNLNDKQDKAKLVKWIERVKANKI